MNCKFISSLEDIINDITIIDGVVGLAAKAGDVKTWTTTN